ncbi:MAG: hypothetical protein WDW36_003311 [Sanguina aurantia]
MNVGEFYSRVPTMLGTKFQREDRMFDDRVTLVVAMPLKLPAFSFINFILQAFSKYAPTTFAELSDRRSADSPSNSTAEGTHVRCFERLLLAKIHGGNHPRTMQAAKVVSDHYRPQFPAVVPNIWADDSASLMRVVIEVRADPDMRQFREVDKLIADCNANGPLDVPGSRYTRVQCITRTFGKNAVEDLAIMDLAEVFISPHGAGQSNAYYMKPQRSMLEVRALHMGTTHTGWANMWQPLVSHQTGFGFFWWSLNIEDPELNDDSKLEKAGVETDPNNNARDRNMKLQWVPLKFMLGVIARVNNSKEVYGREHWDDKARHTSWTLLPGGVIEPAGAIFT